MDSPLTSRISFLDQAGRPIGGPLEWVPALIKLDVDPEHWADVTLSVQGQNVSARLEKIAGEEQIIVPWPRAGTGTYKLTLSGDGRHEYKVIKVRPRKISEEAYGDLIDDLENRLPVSIALALQNAGALSGVSITASHETTLAQEVKRLGRAVRGIEGQRPGLASVLNELSTDPHRILKSEHHWVKREKARRPVASALVQAIIKGGNLDELGRPQKVLDQRVEHTFDVYENRLLKMFHHQVLLRLRKLRSAAAARNLANLLGHIDELNREVRQGRIAASFLDEITLPTVLPMNLTMVLLRRAPYRAALEGFLEFNRGMVIQLDQEIIEAPLENLPALYQTWNTFVVIETLLDLARDHGLEVIAQRLTHRRAGEIFVKILPDGRPALILRDPQNGTKVSLTPEFSIRHGGRQFRSVSFTQRPDIVVTVEKPEEATRMLVLDPKYKLDSEFSQDGESDGQPKKEDIDKMHAYRDAIRSPDGSQPVVCAGILYPGGDVSFGNEIAAISALPGQADSLKERIRDIVAPLIASRSSG